MTEEPNKQEQAPIEKLLLDDPSNFQFHTAYLVYSELFDNATDAAVKKELNSNIDGLKKNEINLEAFYRNIARYRKLDLPRQDRNPIQTQRKKDWRAKEQRSERIRRHKK